MTIFSKNFWGNGLFGPSSATPMLSYHISMHQRRQRAGEWLVQCPPFLSNGGTTRAVVPFYNSIICNFIVYQERFETNLLQLFAHPEKSQRFSTILCLCLRTTLFLNRNKHNWYRLFAFCTFKLSSCPPPCLTAAPASLAYTLCWQCIINFKISYSI